MASTSKPNNNATVSKAMKAFGKRFLEACQSTNTFGEPVTEPILRLLASKDIPPYHQVKAHIILASTRDCHDCCQNVASAKYHISRAEEALELAKRTYVHDPVDAEHHMRFLEGSIRDERRELREYERKVCCGGDT